MIDEENIGQFDKKQNYPSDELGVWTSTFQQRFFLFVDFLITFS